MVASSWNLSPPGALLICKHGSSLPSRNLELKIRLAFISGLLASLLCAHAYSQGYKPFPGVVVDQRTRSLQERVEDVYASGDYPRALLIYEKELAPLGDKYAQYMVGYMNLHAQGVAQSDAVALAWFRLAAERGEPLLEQIRDQILDRMTAEEVAESDRIFLGLWKSMGDRALLLELIRNDLHTLRAQTGTRIPGASISNPATIIRPSGETAGPSYYDDIQARLKARIDYLDAHVEVGDVVLTDELQEIREQEAKLKQELAAIRNR